MTVVIMLLSVVACTPVFWLKERFECGLKCPKNSSCKPVTSGVFMSTNGCVCDYGLTLGGFSRPSRGEVCPVQLPALSHWMTPMEKRLLSADRYAWVCDNWSTGYAYPTPERPCAR